MFVRIPDSKQQEQQLERANVKSRHLESLKHVGTLEKQVTSMKQEKDALQKDLLEAKEKLRSKTKELKETQSQRKLATHQFAELNERVSDLHSYKQRLTCQLRDKEEEMQNITQKVESLRLDLCKAERARKEVEVQLEERGMEAQKERKLRERSEQYSRQLEADLEGLKQKQVGRHAGRSEEHQDVGRLRAELERKSLYYEEVLSRQELLHTSELKGLKKELHEAEAQQLGLMREIMVLKDKLEKTRRESRSEREEFEVEYKQKYEKERLLLSEENKKLCAELDKVTAEFEILSITHRQLEGEMKELVANKDSLSHWEAQISEIIQWVSDEKDARGYLQSLATKMTEELESLRSSGLGVRPTDMPWKVRRLAKLDMSARLELQSALDAEIRAKQTIQEELNKVKDSSISTECKLQESESRNQELLTEIERLKKEIVDLRGKVKHQDSPSSFLAFLNNPSSDLDQFDMDFMDNFISSNTFSKENEGKGKCPLSPHCHSPSKITSVESLEGSPTQTSISKLSYSGSGFTLPKPQAHQFVVKSFSTPTKCNQCTSLMVGLIRQGCMCEVCNFSCHVTCAEKAPPVCPMQTNQTKGPLGIDPQKGIGTAYEGHVRVPKSAGVKKGWQRAIAIVCDFKLFLYELPEGKVSQPSVVVSQVIDMRDEEFCVSSVLASDVIHASWKDIPCIFQVTASQLTATSSQKCSILILADSNQERNKWVGLLNELHRLLKKNKLKERFVYVPKEVYDSTLPLIKTTLAAAIIDHERVALGNEEGLFVIHVTKDEIIRVGDIKKVQHIDLMPSEQLLAVISGRSRHVRLFHMSALDGCETDSYKLPETKGCHVLASGWLCQGNLTCLCVALKRQVICYGINKSKTRHKKLWEIQVPGMVQWMALLGEWLCVGHQAGFTSYSVLGDMPPFSLLHPEDQTLAFISQLSMDAICAVEISCKEFLLCFSCIGIYVDCQGRRSRQQELMWPAVPIACCYSAPYLSVYSQNAVDVFDVNTMEWVQTIPLKKVRPLNSDGSLNLHSLETVRLVYFKNKTAEGDELVVPNTTHKSRKQLVRNSNNKRRFSFRVPEEEQLQQRRGMIRDPERRNRVISNPTNFNHVVHMGPGDGILILKDLPMESHGAFNSSISIPSLGSTTHNGSVTRREHKHITSPPEASLPSHRGINAMMNNPLAVFDREESDSPRHSTTSNSSNFSSSSSPASPNKAKSHSKDATHHMNLET